jgi:hypothetical protein
MKYGIAVAVALLSMVLPIEIAARQGATETRGMAPVRLLESRKPGGAKKKRPLPKYRRTGAALPAGGESGSEIGVTIWRLRPATRQDPASTREILLKKDKVPGEWTPERLEGAPELRFGQRFRLTVETPHSGYLYVIDRSRYADGAPRDPVLVFPTTGVGGGDNRVFAGRAVEVPSRAEGWFFEIGGSEGLEAEELIVLVAPSKLDLPIGPEPITLTSTQLESWEREWGAPYETYEMIGGTGRVMTSAEKAAWTTDGQLLTQGDPLPQTVYRIASKPNSPLFLRVLVRVRR